MVSTVVIEKGKRGKDARKAKRGWVGGNPRYCRARARRRPERGDLTMGRN